MTTAEGLAGLVAVVVVAAVLYYVYSLKKTSGSTDDGIRVKNGSAWLESAGGFKKSGSDFKSKNSANTEFTVTVSAYKSMKGTNPLPGVKVVKFVTTDNSAEHQITTANGKFLTKLKNAWSLANNDLEVRRDDARARLKSMSAVAGQEKLECEFDETNDDAQIELK
jgi:hypothetical protein